MDSLVLALLPPGNSEGEFADHGENLLSVVGGVMLQSRAPGSSQSGVGLQQPETEEQCRGGNEGGGQVDHVVLDERHLDEVLGYSVLEHVHVTSLGVAAEEMEGQRPGEIELQAVEDPQLHLPNVGSGEGTVRDVGVVIDLWSEHLLDLASEEHCANPDKLELAFPNIGALNLCMNKLVYTMAMDKCSHDFTCRNLSIM